MTTCLPTTTESDEDLVSTTIQSPTTTNEPETVAVFGKLDSS